MRKIEPYAKCKPLMARSKCPQTGSNCGFVRKTCKFYCWLK